MGSPPSSIAQRRGGVGEPGLRAGVVRHARDGADRRHRRRRSRCGRRRGAACGGSPAAQLERHGEVEPDRALDLAGRQLPQARRRTPMPALFTSTSTGPASSSTRCTSVAACAGSSRSAGWAVPPSSAASSRSGSSLRATSATCAPAPAKASARARPIPVDAPVMSTRLPPHVHGRQRRFAACRRSVRRSPPTCGRCGSRSARRSPRATSSSCSSR